MMVGKKKPYKLENSVPKLVGNEFSISLPNRPGS
jgi:hypothetical protein